jgi:hypothetical protein
MWFVRCSYDEWAVLAVRLTPDCSRNSGTNGSEYLLRAAHIKTNPTQIAIICGTLIYTWKMEKSFPPLN